MARGAFSTRAFGTKSPPLRSGKTALSSNSVAICQIRQNRLNGNLAKTARLLYSHPPEPKDSRQTEKIL